jgi:hypothetical protein
VGVRIRKDRGRKRGKRGIVLVNPRYWGSDCTNRSERHSQVFRRQEPGAKTGKGARKRTKEQVGVGKKNADFGSRGGV